MPDRFPQAIPEIPVRDLDRAVDHYVRLGFTLDWRSDDGIAGISQGDCRVFLTNTAFREHRGNNTPVVIWLNLNSRSEVDELHQRWQSSGAKILSAPEDKPWNLHEFTAVDLDGNQLRVFYDFTWETHS